MAENCPSLNTFVFETPKAKIIWKLHFINHFYFELQAFTVYFRSTRTLKQTILVIDVELVHVHKIRLTGKRQLLPSS